MLRDTALDLTSMERTQSSFATSLCGRTPSNSSQGLVRVYYFTSTIKTTLSETFPRARTNCLPSLERSYVKI